MDYISATSANLANNTGSTTVFVVNTSSNRFNILCVIISDLLRNSLINPSDEFSVVTVTL